MFTMLSQEQIVKDMVDSAVTKAQRKTRIQTQAQTRAEDVKFMLNRNISEQDIAEGLGLSIKQVRKLASQQ